MHLAGIVPPDLVLVRVDLPDGCSNEKPELADLPKDWNLVPAGPASMDFGTAWAREDRSLVLDVPSVLVREECHAILNPNHPEFAAVKIAIERDFRYDARVYVPRKASRRNRSRRI